MVDSAVGAEEISAVTQSPNATFYDATTSMCDDARCPPGTRDSVRYRDTNHLTVSFVTSFAGAFGRIVGDVLAARGTLSAAASVPMTSTARLTP